MQTIAILNEKGGTGKTTTSVCLSAAIGRLGRKVLLVDLDGQAASSRWLGVEEDTRFADALWKGEGLDPIPDVVPGVSLAPGSGKLDSVAHDLRPTQGGQLRKLLGRLSGFDYTLIDCPPSLGNRLIGNALLAADAAIVPVETSVLALDGLKILLTTLDDVREGFDHTIELMGVLACRYDARTRLSRLILDELNRALPGKVFQTVIRENVRVRECPGSGQVIFDYAPDSHAAEDYLALGREVLAIQERQATCDDGLPPAEARALSEQERSAVAGLHQQMEVLVQTLGSAAGGKQGHPDPVGEPAGSSAPAAGERPDLAEPDDGPQPLVLDTPTEPQTVADAEPVRASDTWAAGPPPARTEPPPEVWTPELDGLRQQTPAPGATASALRESVKELACSQPPATGPDLSEPPPQEGPREDLPRAPAPLVDLPALAEKTKSSVEQASDWPVSTGPGDPPAGLETIAAPAPPRVEADATDGNEQDESDTAEDDDYPALRAMLERIAGKEPAAASVADDDETCGVQDKPGLWRRLLQKPHEGEPDAARATEETYEAKAS